jgi:hypothetical protein
VKPEAYVYWLHIKRKKKLRNKTPSTKENKKNLPAGGNTGQGITSRRAASSSMSEA